MNQQQSSPPVRSPQTVLITGASGALGLQVARRFVQAGVTVHATWFGGTRPSPGPDQPWLERVKWLEMDVRDIESVRRGMPKGPEGHDGVDALVHCAGGFRWTHADEVSDEDLEFLIDTNLKSAFHVVRAVLPGMKKRGFGRIVFVGARATRAGGAGMGPYAASKAGINLLTESLAEEVKGLDINVNAVLPSIIDTPANRRDMPQADPSKWVRPDELADIIFALTQPWSRAIHGALIPVSGRV